MPARKQIVCTRMAFILEQNWLSMLNFIHLPQLKGNSLNLLPGTPTSAIIFDEEEQEEALNMNGLRKW